MPGPQIAPQPYVFPLSPDEICAAIRCPSQAIATFWPLILGCLNDMSLASENVCIGALATIAVETAHQFRPIDEYGGPEYWHKMYDIEGARPDKARELGNLKPGDGVKFHGRGFTQTTGYNNYLQGGNMIGVDLIADPEKAKDPYAAAALFTAFFWQHHEKEAVEAGDWVKARKIVNGGTNGLDDFLKCVARLQVALQRK